MDTSQPAQENSMAAANMLTDIVLPNLLGVDIKISCMQNGKIVISRKEIIM